MDVAWRTRLIDSFRWLDPGPHASHLVSDASGWWRDPVILGGLGGALAGLFPEVRPTVVIAPEVTGFLLGPLVATALGVGFVEAYKLVEGHGAGRDRLVPMEMLWGHSEPDYRDRVLTLGVRAGRLTAADRALIVDDWTATGAQVGALRAALDPAGVAVVGAAVVVDGCPPPRSAVLGVRGLLRPDDLTA
jgi:adenine phosphoribosyltransferase